VFHQLRRAVRFFRCEQQMNVVGHEHVGMNHAAVLRRLLPQGVQVLAVIVIGVETGRPVVAALDDVPRDTGEGEASATGHGETLPE
jgi:hypothetical protein